MAGTNSLTSLLLAAMHAGNETDKEHSTLLAAHLLM